MDNPRLKKLYTFLKEKNQLGGEISEQDFIAGYGTPEKLKEVYGFMRKQDLIDEASYKDENDFASYMSEVVAPEKKNQDPSLPVSGTGSPDTEGDVAPRTFAGQEIPSPVAVGGEAAYLESSQPEVIQTIPGTEPVYSAGVKSNVPKTGEQVIDELRQSRLTRRQQSPYPGVRVQETALVDEKTQKERAERPMSEQGLLPQMGAALGAGGRRLSADVAEIPEYLLDVGADIHAGLATSSMKRAMKRGEVTPEEYSQALQLAKATAKDALSVTPGWEALATVEQLSDEFGGVDKWAARQRAAARNTLAQLENSDKTFEDLVSAGDPIGALRRATIDAAASLPTMIVAMVPYVGAPAIAAAAGKGKYEELADQGYDMNGATAVNTMLTGLAEGLSEAVSGKIGREALKMATKFGRDYAVKGVKGALMAIGGKILGNTLEEGGSEALAQIAENLVDKYTIDRNRNIFDNVLGAAVTGAIAGGGVTATGAAVGATPAVAKGLAEASMAGTQPTKEDLALREALTLDQSGTSEYTPSGANAPIADRTAPKRVYSPEAKQIAANVPLSRTDGSRDVGEAYDAYLDQLQQDKGVDSPEYQEAVTRQQEVVDFMVNERAQSDRVRDNVMRREYLQDLIGQEDATPETKQQLRQELDTVEAEIAADMRQFTPDDLGLADNQTVFNVMDVPDVDINASDTLLAARRTAGALQGQGVQTLIVGDSSRDRISQVFGEEIADQAMQGASFISNGAGKGIVLIHKDKSRADSVVHEGIHAVINRAATNRDAQVLSLVQKIMPHIGAKVKVEDAKNPGQYIGLGEYMERWLAQYNEAQRPEEAFAELASYLSRGMVEVKNKTVLGKIEKAINDFLSTVLGEGKLTVRLTKSGDAVDLFNTLSRGLQYGDTKAVERAAKMFGRAAEGKRGVFREQSKDQAIDTIDRTLDQHYEIKQQLTLKHGTWRPDIREFSLKYVDTGEGAQFFGWGLYFTDKESVANWYARTVSEGKTSEVRMANGKTIKDLVDASFGLVTNLGLDKDVSKAIETVEDLMGDDPTLRLKARALVWASKHFGTNTFRILDDIGAKMGDINTIVDRYGDSIQLKKGEAMDAHSMASDFRSMAAAIGNMSSGVRLFLDDTGLMDLLNTELGAETKKRIVSILKDLSKSLAESELDFQVAVDKINDLFEFDEADPSIYTVTIHNGRTPDEYVYADWNKPINENKKVFEALTRSGILEMIDPKSMVSARLASLMDGVTDINEFPYKSIYEGLVETYRAEKNVTEKEAQKQVSIFMLANGIDGTRYPEGTVSGAGGDGMNYVLYDDSHIEVKEVVSEKKGKVDIRQQKQEDNLKLEGLKSSVQAFDTSDFALKSTQRISDFHAEATRRFQELFEDRPAELQTDDLSALQRAGKTFVAFEQGGSVSPTFLARAFTGDEARSAYEVFRVMADRIAKLKDGRIDKKDFVRGAMVAMLPKQEVPAADVLGIVGSLDEAFISADRSGNSVVTAANAVSLLLNAGVDISAPGGAAADLLNLYESDPNASENRVEKINAVFDAYTKATDATKRGRIVRGLTAVHGLSVAATIVGFGPVKNGSALSRGAMGGKLKAGVDYKTHPLSTRASMLAQYSGLDKDVAQAYLGEFWNQIPDGLKDDVMYDIIESEFGYETQLMAASGGGIDIRQQKASPALRAHPNFKAARAYVKQNYDRISDREIIKNLEATFDLGGSDARELLEAVSGRDYRAPGSPLDGAVENTNRFMRRIGRLIGDPRVKNFRDVAYHLDFEFGNILAPLRKMQREIEQQTGILMPGIKNAYDAMQLYASASLSEIQPLIEWFRGEKGSASSKAKSFVGRLNKVGGINRFNDFLIALHMPERLLRKIDIAERYQSAIGDDIMDRSGINPTDPAIDAVAQTDATLDRLLLKWRQQEKTILDLRARYNQALDRQNVFIRSAAGPNAQITGVAGQIPRIPELEPFFELFEELRQKVFIPHLNNLLEMGAIDSVRYEHLINGTSGESNVVWQYYVPLMYEEDAFNHEVGITNGERVLAQRGLVGLKKPYAQDKVVGEYNLEDQDIARPLDLAFGRLMASTRSKHRQDALRRLAQLVKDHGDPKRVRIFAARTVPKTDKYGNIVGASNLLPDQVLESSISFYENGKVKYIYFADPGDPMLRMFKSQQDVEPVLRGLLAVMGMVMNAMRLGITSLSLSFIPANFLRDVQESSVNMMVENDLLKIPKKTLQKNWRRRWFQAAASQLWVSPFTMTKGARTEMEKYFAEYLSLGASMSWNFDSSAALGDLENQLEKEMRQTEREVARTRKVKLGGKEVLVEPVTIGWGAYNFMMALSSRIENVSRLAAYASLRDAGIDPIRAASIAKNISINFEKKGKFFKGGFGRVMMGAYLFLNAGLQSQRKMIKAVSNPSGRAAMAWFAVMSMGMRALMHAMYRSMDDDDEEEKRDEDGNVIVADRHLLDRYLNSAFMRQYYVMIPNPFDPTDPILAPRPYGALRITGLLADGIVDMTVGKRSALSVSGDMLTAIQTAVDPLGGTLVPTAFKPIYEASINKDWMGRQILFSRSDNRMYAQANKSTPEIYKKAAEIIYDVTPFSISGTHLEHVADGYARMMYPLKLVNTVAKSYREFEESKSDSEKRTMSERLMEMPKDAYESGRLNLIVWKPNLSQDERQDLYNFMAITNVGPKIPLARARWTDEEIGYMKRSVKVIRREELVREQEINEQLGAVALEMLRSGQLDQTGPEGKTYLQTISAMVAPGSRKTFLKKISDARKKPEDQE